GEVAGRLAPFDRRRHVEEDELVGALGGVARGQLDRVAGVAEADEVDALDGAAVADVEAGDDAAGEHGQAVRQQDPPLLLPSLRPQRSRDGGSTAAGEHQRKAMRSSGARTPSSQARPKTAPAAPASRSASRSATEATPPEAMSWRPGNVSARRRISATFGPCIIPSVATSVTMTVPTSALTIACRKTSAVRPAVSVQPRTAGHPPRRSAPTTTRSGPCACTI